MYASLVVLPSSLYSEGTCFTEHVVNDTAGIATGKVLLPNLEGELLAGNPQAGNLSLHAGTALLEGLLLRLLFCEISHSGLEEMFSRCYSS